MIYATVHVTIKNPDSFAAYREQAGHALARYGGTPVAVSRDTVVLEGDIAAPSVAVVLTFPDKDHALVLRFA